MDISYLYERSIFWWINQVGILLEIIGASIIVVASFRTRQKIKDVEDGWDSELGTSLRDVVASQAFVELAGFGLLAVGLAMQFVGGVEQ